ncbi:MULTISPECIES: hypothetical protein [Thalassospira]|uniref:Uncharacterized protein n=2 Tax=Thalassospira TaxID=168934 RepID=A0A367W0Q0_9PROT|nr:MULTISPECIES: hypothetical protein [Thalassospira]MDG4721315.1 hypothetical protein [Thalassospira sp. FZY0004]RCK32948.1 hypothetical protein TH19_18810 [Thalassospira profundimaris]
MNRMENVAGSLMDIWAQSGGAIVAPTADADHHHDHEMQSALLTRSPQTCYSIDQEMVSAQYSGHFPFCIDQEISAAHPTGIAGVCMGPELNSAAYSRATFQCVGGASDHGLEYAMLTRSVQTCYSIDQDVHSAANTRGSLQCFGGEPDHGLDCAMLTRSPQTCYS